MNQPENEQNEMSAVTAGQGLKMDRACAGTYFDGAVEQAVASFSATTGIDLTEEQGWLFVRLLRQFVASSIELRNGEDNDRA